MAGWCVPWPRGALYGHRVERIVRPSGLGGDDRGRAGGVEYGRGWGFVWPPFVWCVVAGGVVGVVVVVLFGVLFGVLSGVLLMCCSVCCSVCCCWCR